MIFSVRQILLTRDISDILDQSCSYMQCWDDLQCINLIRMNFNQFRRKCAIGSVIIRARNEFGSNSRAHSSIFSLIWLLKSSFDSFCSILGWDYPRLLTGHHLGKRVDKHSHSVGFYVTLTNHTLHCTLELEVLLFQAHDVQLHLMTQLDRLEHLGLELMQDYVPHLLG